MNAPAYRDKIVGVLCAFCAASIPGWAGVQWLMSTFEVSHEMNSNKPALKQHPPLSSNAAFSQNRKKAFTFS
jgi:hypothetical protein